MAPSADVQMLVTLALMVDAFILGATWQLLSDPKKRQSILGRLSRHPARQKLDLEKNDKLI